MRRFLSVGIILACGWILWSLVPEIPRSSGESGQAALAGHAPGVVVLDLADADPEGALAELEAEHGVDLEWVSPLSVDEGLARVSVGDPAAFIAALQGDPRVEVAEPELQVEAFGYPDDPLWEKQWNMRAIDVESGWRTGGGRGVKVAVIDTGISRVEDLEGVSMEEGATFVPFTRDASDDHGHGTHVAGTIAQATHNGKGVAGVAPGVTLIPMKALSNLGFGMSDWIASAIEEAVDQGADVINMSLGGAHSEVIHKAAVEAANAGVIVVVAAGNSGREGVSCPGHAEEVVGVAALGPDGERAPYSSWGEGLEIAAPGGDTRKAEGGILQDTIDGKGGHAYRAFQGTSMATPHVAGAAAVLLGMGMDDQAVISTLYSSAHDVGAEGFDTQTGHGAMDLGAAVRRVLLRDQGLLAALAAGLAVGLGMLANAPRGRTALMASTAALTAGGLFILPMLPLPPGQIGAFLARPLLAWPAALDPSWAHFPLWASAILPVGLVFLLGPTSLGALAAGVAVGVGTGLLHGAAAHTIDPWWMGGGVDTAWLVANGTVCLLAAMATVGALKVKDRGGVQ